MMSKWAPESSVIRAVFGAFCALFNEPDTVVIRNITTLEIVNKVYENGEVMPIQI